MLWPLEKHPMTTQSAPKPSQHRQDRTQALSRLCLDALDGLQQLQASIELENKATSGFIQHTKDLEILCRNT
jgi:hypothetical protein